MRYYDLNITDPDSGKTVNGAHWTSYPFGLSGPPDPNALNVQFDLMVIDRETINSNSIIEVQGISIQTIGQSSKFYNQTVTLSGGMGPGLPLVNPQQAGVLLKGTVFQSFGNWIGTEMTLDLVVSPETLKDGPRANFPLAWKRGQSLQDALTQTFKTAYTAHPMPVIFNLGHSYVAPYDINGAYFSLGDLAGGVSGETLDENGNPQIFIYTQAGQIIVTDHPATGTVHQIGITDLIGQPTWIQSNQIQVTTVLRGDLNVGQQIQMPANYPTGVGGVIATANAYPNQFKYQASFTQPLTIIGMRHVGNFRASDGTEWATIMNCVPSND